MLKRLSLISIPLLLACLFVSYLFAEDETITITTYYPSPQGSYNVLGTNYLELGSIDNPPGLGKACYTKEEGQIVYNQFTKAIYYCDGNSWKSVGSAWPPKERKVVTSGPVCVDRKEVRTHPLKVNIGGTDLIKITASCKDLPGGEWYLIGCSGGSGDLFEDKESSNIEPDILTESCSQFIKEPGCVGGDPTRSAYVYAICGR